MDPKRSALWIAIGWYAEAKAAGDAKRITETRAEVDRQLDAADAERERLRVELANSDADCAQAWSELELAEQELLAMETRT